MLYIQRQHTHTHTSDELILFTNRQARDYRAVTQMRRQSKYRNDCVKIRLHRTPIAIENKSVVICTAVEICSMLQFAEHVQAFKKKVEFRFCHVCKTAHALKKNRVNAKHFIFFFLM